jgi:Asp-tRNA(Asn)/Glu-tRNA(Gln) amidotransferase A subunit family amidase
MSEILIESQMFPTVEDCLRRIAEVEDDIRAWVEVAPQPATADGPLRGVPFGVKDIFETRGLATEYGSPLFAGRKGTEDAALVAMLRGRGAILLGKTQTTAFASFDPAPTRNPRVPGHTPGGSSAGSAAAVAAGMVPFAVGTQTLGSVIRPASYCGVCGFKPTFGRIPFDGALPFAPSLDTVGFFARSAREMQWLWRSLGFDGGTISDGRSGAWEAPRELVEAAYTVNRYEGARTHAERYREFGDQIGLRLGELIREGLATPESEYRSALDTIAEWRERVFAEHDFLLGPAATGPAPEGYGSTGDPAMNAPWTAMGCPAITIPRRDFPPIGLQIAAAPGNDAALLAFAVEVEAKM